VDVREGHFELFKLMKKIFRHLAIVHATLWLSGIFAGPVTTLRAEQTFDELQIGTNTYRNVTVSSKSETYAFIIHSEGMTSVKVADMPADIREKLGYAAAPSPVANKLKLPVHAKELKAKPSPEVEAPTLEQAKTQLESQLPFPHPAISMGLLSGVIALVILLYVFQCYCCRLICLKAGEEPGLLIWFPLLQMIPLLRAAGMSTWWILAYFVPGLNLVGVIIWCFKIVEARNKTFWVAILLLVPFTSLFAFLYLAFSDSLSDSDYSNSASTITPKPA
jgi:hypothetical protein